MTGKRETIAVIGGGIAGLTAAYCLARQHQVTLFEASSRLGGHAHSVALREGAKTFEVDTAFLIFNSHSYPNYHRLLAELGLQAAVRETEMSIGISDPARNLLFAANAGLKALFERPGSWRDPSFLKLLQEIRRFRNQTDLQKIESQSGNLSLREYLDAQGYSEAFREGFAYPLGASVWSLPRNALADFPARLFVRFFSNHRLLKRERGAAWQTLKGGSIQTVRRFEERSPMHVLRNSPVLGVERGPDRVTVRLAAGESQVFDRVVIATHADTALKLLARPDQDEKNLLSSWRYEDSQAVLHTDRGVVPRIQGAWPSWNIARAAGAPSFGVTYYLNRIQRFEAELDYFVTLGEQAITTEHEIWRFSHRHPVFTAQTLAQQELLGSLNRDRTFFCGSYFGNGFHEDAVVSALEVASHFGLEL